MRRLRSLAFCLLALPGLARADMVVVAHPGSGIEQLTKDEVINIYLGRYRRLASGLGAEPIDLAPGSELRTRFYRLLVNKSPAEINAYWARLVFSGKTRPPRVADTVDAALRRVASEPGAMAYLDRTQVAKGMKVVFELGE